MQTFLLKRTKEQNMDLCSLFVGLGPAAQYLPECKDADCFGHLKLMRFIVPVVNTVTVLLLAQKSLEKSLDHRLN
jgi:hypothetical protein